MMSSRSQRSSMGLLKHVVLPVLIVVDVFVIYKTLVQDPQGFVDEVFLPVRTPSPVTIAERLLAQAVGGAHVIMAINNMVAIAVENSHYRGMAVLLTNVYYILDALYSFQAGLDVAPVATLAVLTGVGLIVHAREPGIFTTDKNKAKKG